MAISIIRLSTLHSIFFKDASRSFKTLVRGLSSTSSTEIVPAKPADNPEKEVRISKTMKAYLERAQLYENFMKVEVNEYEIGRRHLANMMGADPETFTQDDINKAVEYLMPSGLFEKNARPIFDHPSKLFPKRKEAEFDVAGRPFHYLFYTARSNYYNALHEMTDKTLGLNAHEDKMLANGIFKPEESEKIQLGGMRWANKIELEKIFIEKLTDQEYEQFISCITRLADHPYSAREKSFIQKYCVKLIAVTQTLELLPIQYDENNRPFVETLAYRKHTCASVIVRGNGTGKLDIEGRDITYFPLKQDREQLLFPLDFTDMFNKVDIEAKFVKGEGFSTLSGALRLGISRCLACFVPPDMVEKMRLAGLLTEDIRKPERKKIGQRGPRAKQTWKKR
ncbi:hypothetical protein CHUAL_012601 [Chamberlinius hualienensis]